MDKEQLKNIIDNPPEYDESKEVSIRSMLHDFYCKKMLSTVILVWVCALIFIAIAVFSGIKFSHAEQTKVQIMYAALFICSIQYITLIKNLAWQIIHRNGTKREIKRLELRIAELNETVKSK
jgi:hypothetical protein